MGTRGTVGFVVDKAEKMTYNQFDSYPDGLGVDTLVWLRGALALEGGEELIAGRARELTPAPEGEPTDADRERFARVSNPNVNAGRGWYSLLRETQGKPGLILEVGVYEDVSDWPLDSLFCEYGYVVDFDERRFDAYRGFQRQPVTEGRWAGQLREPEPWATSTYYPIALVASWSFDELPTDDEFYAVFRDEEDED